jgi:hypothetical protein
MALSSLEKNKISKRKIAGINATPYDIAGQRDFDNGLKWNKENIPQGSSMRGRLFIGQDLKWEGQDPKKIWKKRWNKIDEATNRRELV